MSQVHLTATLNACKFSAYCLPKGSTFGKGKRAVKRI